jgi:hypothetical protein
MCDEINILQQQNEDFTTFFEAQLRLHMYIANMQLYDPISPS